MMINDIGSRLINNTLGRKGEIIRIEPFPYILETSLENVTITTIERVKRYKTACDDPEFAQI